MSEMRRRIHDRIEAMPTRRTVGPVPRGVVMARRRYSIVLLIVAIMSPGAIASGSVGAVPGSDVGGAVPAQAFADSICSTAGLDYARTSGRIERLVRAQPMRASDVATWIETRYAPDGPMPRAKVWREQPGRMAVAVCTYAGEAFGAPSIVGAAPYDTLRILVPAIGEPIIDAFGHSDSMAVATIVPPTASPIQGAEDPSDGALGPPALEHATGPPSPGARYIVVAQDGSGDHTTIAEAVEAASDGDTLLVRPGTYEEALVVEKDISILGDGDAALVVVATPREPRSCGRRLSVRCTVWIGDSDALLANLTLRGLGSTGDPVVPLVLSGGAPMAGRLLVEGDILVDGPSQAVVGYSTITGAIRVSGEGAEPRIEENEAVSIRIDAGARPIVEGNRVERIRVRGSGLFRGNHIRGPGKRTPGRAGIGTDVRDPADGLVISENEVSRHRVGIVLRRGGSSRITSNVIERNRIGLRVDSVGDLDIRGNEFCRNDVPVRVHRGPALKGFRVICGAGG
ncbi:MAG: pectinesterase family protein [Chloroflexota bacterium]